jgi:asparagine synthase (glutamine-hydrolysing)
MCGICGAFAYKSARVLDPEAGRKIRDRMVARGPDGAGEWLSDDGRVWLGHRRLAIIDLSPTGAQPMTSSDGKLFLTFNGEIYNYMQLRRQLEAKGFKFRSTADTEVIIHLYRSKGPSFVSELRGMFAFALWDAERQKLIAARDPYGIKPFYYSDCDGIFSFASSVKALMASRKLSQTADPAGAVGFFIFGSVPEPWTTYRDVRALPAGMTMTIDRSGLGEKTQYFSIPRAIKSAEEGSVGTSGSDAGERMREALLDSVRHHLVADVPVGAFLSAGVDSGALVGLMRDAGQAEIRTVTLIYDELSGSAGDEGPLASQTALLYGTAHRACRITAKDFNDNLPAAIAAMDQPSIDGINSWFVSKAAHDLGLKVVISGVGGDELLGGYSTFLNVPRLAGWSSVACSLSRLASVAEMGVAAAARMGANVHPKLAGLLRYGGNMAGAYLLQRGLFLPSELDRIFADTDFVQEGLEQLRPQELIAAVLEQGPTTIFGQVAALESCFYLRNQLLRDTDWAGMDHSLEIRTPLVDHVLLKEAATLMTSELRPNGKMLLARSPSRALPDATVNRKKTGFSIPIHAWLGASSTEAGYRPRHRVFSRDWACRVAELSGNLPALKATA